MLDARTLNEMRGILNQYFLNETMQIYTVSIVRDVYGQETVTRTLSTTVEGQVNTVSGSEVALLTALVDTGMQNKEAAKFVLPYGTNVAVNDEIRTADGKYWKVAHVGSSKTFTAALEVLVVRDVITAGE